MPIPILTVDAFTDRPFAGNPAAVALLDAPRPDDWMQAIAREMNLSETAFVEHRGDAFSLRWFTPTIEVDLCGHATLASAHVLWTEGRVPPAAAIAFDTRSGVLTCRPAADGWIEMDFPATPAVETEPPPDLARALGVEPRYVGRSRFDYLVQVASAAEVRTLAPDLALLRTLPVRGVCVTAPSGDPSFDFVSRFFAPAAGVDEDPATGSAHCMLAPFWGERLGKRQMAGVQLSSRGGVVRVRLAVARDRVILSGQAVTVLRGTLL